MRRFFEPLGRGSGRLMAMAIGLLLLSLSLQSAEATTGPKPVIQGPSLVELGQSAAFDANASSGSIINYTWDFRDGSVAYEPLVRHAFSREGTYLLGLTLTDAGGRQALGTHRVQVVNSPPVAAAEAHLDLTEIRPLKLVDLPGPHHVEVSEDQPFILSAASSSDAPPDLPHLSYTWFLGDGRDESGKEMVVSYPDEGLYRVVLRVTDPHGAFDTDEILVRVVNVPPTAVLGRGMGGPEEREAIEDQVVVLDGTRSTDTPSDQPTLTYAWDLGDGTRASGPRVAHGYPRAGRYLINLTVTDDNGAASVDRLWVSVRNRPPKLGSMLPRTVGQGSALLLAAEARDDPTDAPGLRYFWNWEEAGREAVLSWSKVGTYDVALEVVDDDGAVADTRTTVEVQNVAPHVSLSDAYVVVRLEASLTGAPRNRVALEVLRGRLQEESMVLDARQVWAGASPAASRELRVRLDDVWSLRATYLLGEGHGPPWVNRMTVVLTFEDGRVVRLGHLFAEWDSGTWTWGANLNRLVGGYESSQDRRVCVLGGGRGPLLGSVPVHFLATIFDPGQDRLTAGWSFDGRQGPVNDIRTTGQTFRDLEIEVVRTFLVPLCEVAELRASILVTDEHGGWGADEISLTWDGTVLLARRLGPRVEPLDSVLTEEGVPILLSAEAISGSQTPLQLSWDLGDGTMASGREVEHVYERPGLYLGRVSAEAGSYRTVRGFAVRVEDTPPVARARLEGERVQDGLLLFDASLSGSTSSQRAGLLYHWDFGDGAQAAGPTVTHSYSRPGTYLMALKVVDPEGSMDQVETTVEIANVPPHPAPVTAYRAEQDQVLRVEAPITDTPSDAASLSYRWFSRGDTITGRSLTIAYGRPGDHRLIAEAFDGSLWGKTVVPVSVANREPEVHTPSLTYYGPRGALLLEGQGMDAPSDLRALSFQWRFGDGQEGWGRAAYHTYPATGEYRGELVVRDPWGSEASLPFSVRVTYDADGDGLSTEMEASLGTSDAKADTDGDGRLDWVEALYPDTDEDGLWDGVNTTVTGTLLIGEGSVGTDPLNPDTDGEGLPDGAEVKGWRVNVTRLGETIEYDVASNPLLPDADEDGLTDLLESLLGLDPTSWDTDGDGLWDDEDPDPLNDDTDGDGVPDGLDRVPEGSASLSFKTKFPPGLVRFRQPFSVFSVEGHYAWVYQHNLLSGACQFRSDETQAATRSSVVDGGKVLAEILRTFQEGGEENYVPTRAEYLYEQGTSYQHFTYGGCDFWSPKQYKIGYAVPENKWAVDFKNVREVEVQDGFSGKFQFALEQIPVRKGHPISLVLQYTLPPASDKTTYEGLTNYRIGAIGYTVYGSEPGAQAPLFANAAMTVGLTEGAYQVELRIPASVTAQAPVDSTGRPSLQIVMLPFWLDVKPYAVNRLAWDMSSVHWAGMSLEVPIFIHQVIARLSIDMEDLEAVLPRDLGGLASGFHIFGPYRVYVHGDPANSTFDPDVLTQADAVLLMGISESDVIAAREAIEWGPPGSWYEEGEDAFNSGLQWFKTGSRLGGLSIPFLEFRDIMQTLINGKIEFPDMPLEPGERDVTITVEKALVNGKVVFIQKRWVTVDVAVTVDGVRQVWVVRKPMEMGRYDRIEEVPVLKGRYITMRAAMRGAAIGAILVTWGRTGILAFVEGDYVKGSVYTAATSTSVFSTLRSEIPLSRLGLKSSLSLSVGKLAMTALGTIFASYHLFLASQTADPITQLSHLEQASAWTIDTSIMVMVPYGAVIVVTWSVTVAFMSIIMPNTVAASVTSSPGAFATFIFEYIFGGGIPSSISEDAFKSTASWAISQMRQWNSVFQIPSVVVLPQD